jgi:hypothetical protein
MKQSLERANHIDFSVVTIVELFPADLDLIRENALGMTKEKNRQ